MNRAALSLAYCIAGVALVMYGAMSGKLMLIPCGSVFIALVRPPSLRTPVRHDPHEWPSCTCGACRKTWEDTEEQRKERNQQEQLDKLANSYARDLISLDELERGTTAILQGSRWEFVGHGTGPVWQPKRKPSGPDTSPFTKPKMEERK